MNALRDDFGGDAADTGAGEADGAGCARGEVEHAAANERATVIDGDDDALAAMVAMRREDGTYAKPQLKKASAKLAAAPVWMWPLVVAVVSIVAIVVSGFLYNTKLKQTANAASTPAVTPSAVPSATPTATAASPSPTPTQIAKAPMARMAPSNAGAAMAPMPAPAPSPSAAPMTGKFAADSVPFINERIRNYLAGDYSAAGDYKAFALNIGGFTGSVLNQPSEEAARNGAIEQCQKRADAAQSPRRCELYAVGNNVVYAHGKPPMPPAPYFRHARQPIRNRLGEPRSLSPPLGPACTTAQGCRTRGPRV